MTVLTLTAGTAFIMWLGEQMSEKGDVYLRPSVWLVLPYKIWLSSV